MLFKCKEILKKQMRKVYVQNFILEQDRKARQRTVFSKGCSTEHQGTVKGRRAEQTISRSIVILIANRKPTGPWCTLEF